ncbi:MAG: hypothetical protein APR62_01665 [Smithella sp. SDB]|nr:MAG: hypothetical protein APR62_01665 [Smithella sp. SDB]
MKELITSGRILILIFIMLIWAHFLLVEGCARIPLNYLPGSINKISGRVSISNFKYIPAESGQVKPYQIRNTSFGSLNFDKNIDTFFRNAVFAHLRSARLTLDDKNKVLSGEIEDFLIDELSAGADWTLKVNYSVKNQQTGKHLYESTKVTRCNASKLANISSVVNEMVKLNVEELLKDAEFLKTIK